MPIPWLSRAVAKLRRLRAGRRASQIPVTPKPKGGASPTGAATQKPEVGTTKPTTPTPEEKPGFFRRQIDKLDPATRDKILKAREWQLKNHLGWGNLINAGFWGYTIGSDLANGESIGGTAGSALGFMAGDAAVNKMIPKSKTGFGWGAARMIGSLAGGMAASMAGQHLGNKYAPIGRLAKPIEETY